MKKIFAILISFLFIVSVFGVASLAGICPITSSSTTVHVGDTFTITYDCGYIQFMVCPDRSYVEIVEIGWGYTVLRAVKPGTVNFPLVSGSCETPDPCDITVTILRNEYPMFSFMKILGLGKTD